MNDKLNHIISDLQIISDTCNTIELYYDSIEEAIEMLEDNKNLVLCRNCKNRFSQYCPMYGRDEANNDEWFCGNGEAW